MTGTPDRDDALEAVLLPDAQSTRDLQRVFERGFLAWQQADDIDREGLVSDVERFTLAAIEPSLRERHGDDPLFEQPAALAVVATLGAVAVVDHPTLSDTPRRTIKLLDEIRTFYAETVRALMETGIGEDRVQTIAEHLYSKPASEDGPHPGRTCTGVTTLDDGVQYVEIPLPAASRECIARAEHGDYGGSYDRAANAATGEIVTRLQNNAVYVPVAHTLQTHHEYLIESFDSLLEAHEAMLTEAQREWLTNETGAISDRIDRFLRGGQQELIWSDWDPERRKISVLRSVVLESGHESEAAVTAAQLFDAIDTYEPSADWEQSVLERIASPKQLARLLHDLAESTDRVVVESMPAGVPDEYRLRATETGADTLQIDAIEDLFELPCFAAMDERLEERGPVRKDLYSFVRLVMWLPEYRELGLDALLEELHSVFERWPWYDPVETEYQIRYEFDNEIDGEPPLPMNCDNPDMQRYCIGQEECPYSIYGSLPFPEEMYDQLTDERR